MRLASILGVAGAAVLGFAAARWLNPGPTDIRSTPAGQVDMSAAAPRLNGRPDLSGLWEAERTPTTEFVRVLGPGLPEIQPDLNEVTKHTINVFWDVKPEDVPLRPQAAAITEARQKSGKDFQSAYCLPSGVPASTLTTQVKMVQGPREIAVLSGGGDPPREIYIDGRTLPQPPEPSWMGTSAGHWQEDTLVVETTSFKEAAWLDLFGHPRSEAMRITERFRRRDFGHMDLEMTFDDPKYYTRPFGFKTTMTLLPDDRMYEFVCTENQKFRDHLPN
jgi:hypothetical protein